MNARAHLRAASAQAHERVDRLFSAFLLGDPLQYGRFLGAQAAAFLPTEQAIDAGPIKGLLADWPERRRAAMLLADLTELGRSVPAPLPAPELTDAADLLGAVYVLEGSRLGGAYLKRAVASGMPLRFLDTPQPRGAWRSLLAVLDRQLDGTRALAQAAQSAVGIFDLFERAALRELDQRQAA